MIIRSLLVPVTAAGLMLAGCTGPTTGNSPTPAATGNTATSPFAPTATPGTNGDEAAIRQAGRARTQAMLAAGTSRLDDLLADDFTAVHITGYEQSKDEWLEQIRAGEMAYHDVQEQSASVAIDGDTAVLTSRNLVTATIGGSRGTWRLESTTTYVKTGGTWLATRSRSTTY